VEALVALLGHVRADEGERRMLLDGEEVLGAQMLIAVVGAGVDAPGVDREGHRRRLRNRRIEADRAGEIGETAANPGDEVTNLEDDFRVRLVDRERAEAGASAGCSHSIPQSVYG